jgi:starch phosphorylase
MENLGQDIRKINDERLWEMRTNSKAALIKYSRERLSRQLVASGASSGEVEYVNHLFDPNALTLGFARRFATYKRPDLLLHDPQRLIRLLSDSQHPVQLILAGKAHPADQACRGCGCMD